MAVLVAFLAGTYAWNKDKPKTAGMFSGGPPAGAPAAGQPAAAAGPGFSGMLDVAPELKDRVPQGGTVFLIVRNAGMPDRGPPLAVRRAKAARLPLAFEITGSDVMMPGLTLEGPFDVYARFDRDGNAMTKDPGDLTLSKPVSGVKVGDTDIRIVLDRVSGEAPTP